MAIASDPALGSTYAAQTTYKAPTKIDPTSSINATLAQGEAMGDFRANIKGLDKAGFSRGAGSAYAAGLAGMKAIGDSRNAAAQTQMQADVANNQMQQDYEYGREMEGQKLAMVQQAMSQSDWSVALAQQQAAARINSATQAGQLQVLNAIV